MATIKDIAKLAGVSRGTVDRVLHGRGRVSAENEARIREAIAQLSYEPGEAGMALAAHKKELCLGFLYPEMEQAPFFAQVYEAAREKAEELAKQGVEVRFFPVREEDAATPEHLRELLSWLQNHTQVSGWAAPGYFLPALREVLAETESASVPLVAYNMDSDQTPRLAYVGCDYRHAGRIACGLAALMTEAAGQVLFMSIDAGNYASSAQRLAGFLAEMQTRYPRMRVVERVLSTRDILTEGYAEAAADDAVADAVQALRRHPEVDVVYIANPGNYAICPKLREAAGGRTLHIITNDLVSEAQRQMLLDGTIDATICQEPERQGRRPLEILYDALAFHRAPEEVWEKTRLTIETAQSITAGESIERSGR